MSEELYYKILELLTYCQLLRKEQLSQSIPNNLIPFLFDFNSKYFPKTIVEITKEFIDSKNNIINKD